MGSDPSRNVGYKTNNREKVLIRKLKPYLCYLVWWVESKRNRDGLCTYFDPLMLELSYDISFRLRIHHIYSMIIHDNKNKRKNYT